MVKKKSYIRLLREDEGDRIVMMQVFERDRTFLQGSGLFTCARDNLSVLVNNIRLKRQVNDVGEYLSKGIKAENKSDK